MMLRILLEMLLTNSFFFAWKQFISFEKDPLKTWPLFVAGVLCTSLAAGLRLQKKPWWPILLLPIFPCAWFFGGVASSLLSLLLIAFHYAYLKESLLRGYTEGLAHAILLSYALLFFFMFFQLGVFIDPAGGQQNTIPFFFPLYIILSIFYLRITRQEGLGEDRADVRRTNLIFTGSLVALLALFYQEPVRNRLFSGLQRLSNGLSDLFLRGVFSIFGRLFSGGDPVPPLPQQKAPITSLPSVKDLPPFAPIDAQTTDLARRLMAFLNVFLPLLLILILGTLLVYVVYRIFLSLRKSEDAKTLRILREKLEPPRQKKHRLAFLNRDPYPKEAPLRVRWWYRRYLRTLEKEIHLTDTDTTKDVADKGLSLYPGQSPTLRTQYLKARYGEEPLEEDSVAAMEKAFHSLQHKE
ncbi:hypothetical protein ABB02_00874 [Clostridiaceae bacterium JG1575]|nr:hypothetical protein ABB02_00874 [Clostridiaceae bacterium JG1575]